MNPLLKPGAEGLKTRDGRDVRIYATDGSGNYPIHGAIKLSDGWEGQQWCDNGSFLYRSTQSYNDIMLPEPWQPSPEFWNWLPEEYLWLAMDEDSLWYLFKITKPDLMGTSFRNGRSDCVKLDCSFVRKHLSGFTGNWKDSLFERP